jgi:hypothetical protein
VVVVDVGVDERDRLPGAESEKARDDRHHDRRSDERREDVVAAMTG